MRLDARNGSARPHNWRVWDCLAMRIVPHVLCVDDSVPGYEKWESPLWSTWYTVKKIVIHARTRLILINPVDDDYEAEADSAVRQLEKVE